MVLGDHHLLEDHVADVLASRIAEGKGFLSFLFSRQKLNETVLGIKYIGRFTERATLWSSGG